MADHRTISIADQIFDQLERDILSGRYQRGETISELQLSRELGVSRTPIREAVRRLEQEHILEESSRGLTVVGITHEDILDMYEIRARLEGLAAERAAANITAEQLSAMGELLEMQKYYIDRQTETGRDYSEKIREQDSQFHEALYESCGSRALADTLLPIHKKTMKYRMASVRQSSRARDSLAEHMEIYEALRRGDGAAAAELACRHVEKARSRIADIRG